MTAKHPLYDLIRDGERRQAREMRANALWGILIACALYAAAFAWAII